MAFHFKRNPFTSKLHNTSRSIAPLGHKREQILHNVLDSVGKSDEAQYSKAAYVVEQLLSTGAIRLISRIVASGTGLAILVAAFFLYFPPGDVPGHVPQTMPGQGEGTQVLPAALSFPIWEAISTDDTYLYIHFNREDPGERWATVYAVDNRGARIEPVRIDREERVAVFLLPADPLRFYCEQESVV